ncbi:hypothetical protein ACFQZ4_45275 [Catellatospora coxensis]
MTALMPQLTGGRVLREALRGQAGRITGSALLSTGHQAGEAMVPVVIGLVVDRAVGTGSSSELLVWLGVLGAVFVTLSFSFRFGARLGERAAEQAGHVLRVRLTDRVLDARGGADTGRLPGALASVATSDAGRVGMVALALPSASRASSASSSARSRCCGCRCRSACWCCSAPRS